MFSDLPQDRDAVLLYERRNKAVRVFRISFESWQKRCAVANTSDKEQHDKEEFVVIKLLDWRTSSADDTSDQTILDSAKREVASLSLMRAAHPMIPRLLGHDLDGANSDVSQKWIATSYVRALPLQKLFVSGQIQSKLPRALIAGIVAQLAFTLFTHVHGCHGIVFRDLKLPNILFDPRTGSVHLVDFGCSCKVNSADDEDRKPIGTLHVRAPEMYRPVAGLFNATSFSCDLYALGCVLVELLTGKPAFGSFESSEEHGLRDISPVIELVQNSSKGKFAAEDAAAAELVAALLDPDPARRVENTGCFAKLMRFQFFVLSAVNHVKSGEYGDGEESENPAPFDIEKVQVQSLSMLDWMRLCADVVRSYENVEEETELALVGM